MSQINDIIGKINKLTGYQVPTSSNYIISQSANPNATGSVFINGLITQLNNLTGYNIPLSNVTIVSGSNLGPPLLIYTPYAQGGTISTDGIVPGLVIKAEQVLRVINALNGVNINDIIISGSLQTSGSNVFNGTLSLPFIEDGRYLITSGGYIVGTTADVTSASYAEYAAQAGTAILAPNYVPISVTSSMTVLSSSYAQTASYALNVPIIEEFFLRNQTRNFQTDRIYVNQSIFNPSNLTVLTSSIFIIDSSADYYILGDLINSGLVEVTGSLKVGGNIKLGPNGSITGPGIIT